MIFVLLNKVVSCVSDHVKNALKAKSRNAPLQVVDESDKRANYLLKFCRPITETINFILAKIDPGNDEEELITCAASTVSLMVHMWGGESLELGDIDRVLEALSRRNQRLILKALRKATTEKLVQNRSLLTKIERIASLSPGSNITYFVSFNRSFFFENYSEVVRNYLNFNKVRNQCWRNQ